MPKKYKKGRKKEKRRPIIEEKAVHVLRESGKGKLLYHLRILSWCVDGRIGRPKLEKRQYHVQADGSVRMGKCQGFLQEELEFIVSEWDEIKEFFNG